MSEHTEAQTISENVAAKAAIDGTLRFDHMASGQIGIVPEGFELVDLESFQARPNNIKANHTFVEPRSLAHYVNRFGDDRTAIFADSAVAKISANLDGDTPTTPSHKTHHAHFEAQHSDVLSAWLAVAGRTLTQMDFGRFLEDHAINVQTPDPASIMDMVMTFDAVKSVTFTSRRRLHDGMVQFAYHEENESKGNVTLPDRLTILAPVYQGLDPQVITFMIRFDISEGKLRFKIEMHQKDAVFREAFQRCVDSFKAELSPNRFIYVTG